MTRRRLIAVALGVVLLLTVALGIFWFGWVWKALIGWRALVDYIDPKNATNRKDAVQVYALIVAGVVATITAAVGLFNLYFTRKNLEQQRVLEAQRAEHQRELAQGTALQAYYEQIGKLLTEYDLRNTQREEIRQLARGQTLTVLKEVDKNGKASLLTFLHGAGLIGTENPAVALTGANLQGANLQRADLRGANLQRADLRFGADFYRADLRGADLSEADLPTANLRGANLQAASLQGANLQAADLPGARLQRANLKEINRITREAEVIKEGAGLVSVFTDLQLADLQEADLQGAYLVHANLERANLQGANLQGAYLQDVNLESANLREAALQGANLETAYLVNANLQAANLQDANLWFANLERADLREADLQGAYLQDVNLESANLQAANLQGAYLHNANLQGAKVTNEQLALAATQTLQGATMPDGQKSMDWLKDKEDYVRRASNRRDST